MPASESVSQTADPKPPARTPSSTVTSRSCSAASWAARPESIGFAKRASATVTAIPSLSEEVSGGQRLADAGAVAEQRDRATVPAPSGLAQDLAGADLDYRG